ncbi:MAG: sulfatase-like hydrolase/transferase, partial [Sulfitobacter sp.]|nr:sulfatase-like hydrolase/transferase [Sulfitobacter sp.]
MFHFFRPLYRNPYFHQVDDGSIRHETDHATDLAIDFLQDATADSPFSLSVSFNAPHAEDDDLENHYPSPTSAKEYYEKDDIPPPQLSDPSIFQALPDFLKSSLNRERYFWRWDTQEKYQKNMRSYFRMITGIDLAIGRIQAELTRKNLDRNTIIIYMSDNGYYMGERGLAGKWSHFDQSLKIPLIIYDPR